MRLRKLFTLLFVIVIMTVLLSFSAFAEEESISSEQTSASAVPFNIPDDALEYNGHHYYVYSSSGGWAAAKLYCESKGGHLATITSKEEDEKVYAYIKSKGITSAYFGYTDEKVNGIWEWVTGEEVGYDNWADGEPNDSWGPEPYAMYYYTQTEGQWNDARFGDTTNSFICEWEDTQHVSLNDRKDSVTITVKATETNGSVVPIEGATVTLYVGSKAIKTDTSDEDGKCTFGLTDLTDSPWAQATVSAYKQVSCGKATNSDERDSLYKAYYPKDENNNFIRYEYELHSETIDINGNWVGKKIREEGDSIDLLLSEPRIKYNLSVCYLTNEDESDSSSIEKMLSKYALNLAQATDGHVMVNNIILFSTNNYMNFWDTGNNVSVGRKRPETVGRKRPILVVQKRPSFYLHLNF